MWDRWWLKIQIWLSFQEQQWIVHGVNPRCLDSDPGRQMIYVAACDTSSLTQKWRFENIDFKALSNWDNIGPN
jgi:polypeptide N-acetylgalactosaminyltransferase